MGSDRQSILIHENGKKHRENVEISLKKQREAKLQLERERNLVTKTLQKMNEAVLDATPDGVSSSMSLYPPPVHASFPPVSLQNKTVSNQRRNKDMHNKESKPLVPKEEKDTMGPCISSTDDASSCTDVVSRKRKLIHEEGYYTLRDDIFLSGPVFYEIFELDMAVEIFTGSPTMTQEYQRSIDSLPLWKTGVIVKIHGKDKLKQDDSKPLFDISYLNDINDEDETIEKRVDPSRLRLRLGVDELAPKTLEEAEVALMGGEDLVTFTNSSQPEIDENTGLSQWTSVSVRKITAHQERREERERQRLQKQEEKERLLQESKEREMRRLEEAKYLHSHDSALGAYDVFNTMTGYKGVSIHEESTQAPQGKVVHSGPVSVVFKSGVAGSTQKRMRRTMADDSDQE
jgi:WW domain-binding protein 4